MKLNPVLILVLVLLISANSALAKYDDGQSLQTTRFAKDTAPAAIYFNSNFSDLVACYGGNPAAGDIQKRVPVSIDVEPSVVEFFIDGKALGPGPTFMLPLGEHTVRIVKTGYRDFEAKIHVLDTRNSFHFRLKEERYNALRVESEPTGATVYVDQKRVGETPYSSFFAVGEHEVQIQKKGYESISEKIRLKGSLIEKHYYLKPSETGITHAGQEPGSGSDNQNLTKLPAARNAANGGSVQVNVVPGDSHVRLIDEHNYEYTIPGSRSLEKLPAGSYELVVSRDGYATHRETFLLIPGQKMVFDVNLIGNQSSLQVRQENSGTRNYFTPVDESMVLIKGGRFKMGSLNGDPDEKPVHKVSVDDFYMAKFEVTQAQWQELMGSNPSGFKGQNRPVESVTWLEAVKFCNKKSVKEGLTPAYTIKGTSVVCDFKANGYRLPTEAEWEYAARKDAEQHKIAEVAWIASNSGTKSHYVGLKKAGASGLHDLMGNVWEWCWDWYDKEAYKSGHTSNPTGPSGGTRKVVRGGSWYSKAGDVRISNRYPCRIDKRASNIGLRLVRSR